MLKKEIIDGVENIYALKDYWGAGKITRLLKPYLSIINLNIPEKFFIRSAEILNIKGTKSKHRGIDCILYSKSDTLKVLEYYFNNTKKQRSQDWLKLHPEEVIRRKENKIIINEKRKQKIEEKEKEFITIAKYASKYNTRVKTFKLVLNRLNVPYEENIITKDYYPIIDSYFNSLPKNTYERGRIFAKLTSQERFGTTGYNSIPEIKNKLLNTRSNLEKEGIEYLNKKYNSVFLNSKEAQNYISKNNSTLIAGFKLLNLPLHKIGNQYVYNKEDLDFLKDFINHKTSLKGSIARALQLKLDEEHINYVCEKTFPNLKDKNPLRCDYYIPNLNTVIEVQGGQHFKPVNYQGLSEKELLKEFKALQNRDKIKKEYFKEHNINFIEVITSDDINKCINIIKKMEPTKKDV